jgi:hypothetical protein
MTKFKLLGAVAVLSAVMITQAPARGIEGRGLAAPLWSAACVADHGRRMCGETGLAYGARGRNARENNALSPEADSPHLNGAYGTRDDWPANMILG